MFFAYQLVVFFLKSKNWNFLRKLWICTSNITELCPNLNIIKTKKAVVMNYCFFCLIKYLKGNYLLDLILLSFGLLLLTHVVIKPCLEF
jgi:hypothetical protein